MEKVYLLKEQEAREISIFLSLLLTDTQKEMLRGHQPSINIKLLEHYKKELWS